MLKTKKDIKNLEANLNYIKNSLNQFTEDHFNESIKNNWTRLGYVFIGGFVNRKLEEKE